MKKFYPCTGFEILLHELAVVSMKNGMSGSSEEFSNIVLHKMIN